MAGKARSHPLSSSLWPKGATKDSNAGNNTTGVLYKTFCSWQKEGARRQRDLKQNPRCKSEP
jgi:hypothetical protein